MGGLVAERARLLVVLMLFALGSANVIADETSATVPFDIRAQNLGSALNEFARQSGKEIFFVEREIAGLAAQAVTGRYAPIDALERLLAGTDLRYRINDLDTILVGSQIQVIDAGSETSVAAVADLSRTVIDEAEAPGRAEDAPALEEILVSGIRLSLQRSVTRKRHEDRFIDVITAEDIGAFPDQNLAESLQRVSGVAIDRKEGEGTFVTIRGLDPQFVQNTVNGRALASNVDPGQLGFQCCGSPHAGSRAVAYDQFQSGLVDRKSVV